MTQREEFEAWMQTRPGYPFAGQFANLMWAAWQAAKAKPPVNVAKLGKRLAELLDEDQFAECEQLLLGIGTAQAAQPVREPAGSIRLWDAQWVSIVNHDNAYNGWSTNDAVNHAVRMTERYIAANVAQNNLPPLPAAQEVK